MTLNRLLPKIIGFLFKHINKSMNNQQHISTNKAAYVAAQQAWLDNSCWPAYKKLISVPCNIKAGTTQKLPMLWANHQPVRKMAPTWEESCSAPRQSDVTHKRFKV